MKNSRKTQMAILAIVSLLVFGGILMSAVTLPYTLTNGTMADADQVMANFSALSSSFGTLTGNNVPYWSGIDKKFMDSGIYWNGTNVGIGTTTPSYKLDVAGDININGTGKFKINGVDLASGIGGGGTINFLPKFTSGTSLGNSIIFDNGTNVGIGTTSPTAKLHILGDLQLQTDLNYKLYMVNNPGTNDDFFQTVESDGDWWNVISELGGNFIFAKGNYPTLPVELMRITNTGNVGIGETNPTSKLSIYNGNIQLSAGWNLNWGNIGTSVSGSATDINYSIAGSERMRIDSFGKVGIGTTTPLAGLHVNKIAEAGLSETISRFSVSDNSSNYLQITNGSTIDSLYLPKIYAYAANTSETALTIEANCGNNDAKIFPTMVFNSLSNSGTIGAKDLFDFRNNGASKMIIAANGNVGIGTTNPAYRLQVGEGSNYGYVDATGAWVQSSDIRFKENVRSLSSKTCLDKVNGISAIEYNVIGDDKRQIGFSAQDIERIIPEIVSTDINGYKGVGYAGITPILVEAIKELKNENDQLKEENNQLSIRLRLIEEKLGIR